MSKQYIIDEKELKRLIDRDNELLRLEYNGVDNWGGYDMDGDEDEDTLTTEEYIVVNFKELNLEKEAQDE